jgi:hypothetical protein
MAKLEFVKNKVPVNDRFYCVVCEQFVTIPHCHYNGYGLSYSTVTRVVSPELVSPQSRQGRWTGSNLTREWWNHVTRIEDI